MEFREEKDSLGTVNVPADAYWGAQTQRAFENFPVSGITFPQNFIRTLSLIKKNAAIVNRRSGRLDKEIADAITEAAGEVSEGKLNDQFIVDIFQTGSGTSTNMNMNEVIASRANEILTGKRGGKEPVHPNDHVNMGHSSNDSIPSAIRISAIHALKNSLIPSLGDLESELNKKAVQFKEVEKIGRTHLQDAVKMTLGDEFSGYSRQVRLSIERLGYVERRMSELPLGGTAVGTGINTDSGFASDVIKLISSDTGIDFIEAENHFEAQAAKDAEVELSSILKTIAVSLTKIANDIRWLASGPRCGIGEIKIPSLQPGSSIMPGKVNPVIPESVLQVAAQVIGNDSAITIAGQSGNFELNVMMPVIAYNLLMSLKLLSNATRIFSEKCVRGIEADEEKCRSYIEKSLAMATGLIPHIGYDRAAEIAKKAYIEGKTVREIISELDDIPDNLI